jgi:hypothetical protein
MGRKEEKESSLCGFPKGTPSVTERSTNRLKFI